MADALHSDDRQRLLEAIEVARMVCRNDRAALELEQRGVAVGSDAAHQCVYRAWTADGAKATTLVRTLSLALNVLADDTPFEPAYAMDRAFDNLAAAVEHHR